MISLDDLNRLSAEDFVHRLQGIFEHSPWIARRAAPCAPFSSRLQLLQQLRAVVKSATFAEQLALINAHPKLASRGKARQQLTQECWREQKKAGLDACSDDEYAHLARLNVAYGEKFGFPFILAVRGHDPPSIIAHLKRRLQHDQEQEMQAALHEIGLIASYRLADAVASDAATEVQAMLHQFAQAAAAPLIIEWMRAASLTVCRAEAGQLIGLSSGISASSRMLIMGLHYDPDSRALVYDGRLGCAIGIAISQQMRQQGRQLQFDLAVFSSPHDKTGVSDFSTLALNAPSGCIGMQSVDADRGDSREILAALRAVGLSHSYFVIMNRGASDNVQSASLLPQQLGRAVGALQEFLLHTQDTTDAKGQSLSHG